MIAIVKDWRKLKFSPYTCPQIFRSWLPRRPLFDAPCPPMANKSEPTAFSAPLILCDLWPDGGATYAFFPAGSPHRQDKRQAGHWQTGARIKPGF
ncbi:MAG TPA: hypothetical protein PLB25_06485 [Rhodoferax sp.]|nr:hypothetical protein [Rhodoferax sp.]